MKKFKLTNETKIHLGIILHRIKALRDIPKFNIKKGDLGGFVEKESNLSHEFDSWVSDNAQVYGNAQVYDNARVFGNAQVSGNAWVSGNALIFDNAQVYGDSWLESSKDIMNIIIPSKFSITITPQNITIGCQLKTRKEWLKVSKKEAIKMGLPANMYDHYRLLIKTGMKLIPERR